MFPGLFTAPLRIVELFSDPFRFTVPSYQRRYAWTVKEAGQLLDDILLALGGEGDPVEPDYFFGAILLTDSGVHADWRKGPPLFPRNLEIVDGQQRLITVTILLAVLRDLAAADGASHYSKLQELITVGKSQNGDHTHRLQLQGSDDAFFRTYVLNPRACLQSPTDIVLEPCMEAMLEVRNHFMAEMQALTIADRQRILDYLLNRCHAVVIVTTDVDHGHRMFSVLNDRGRPLARKDIIKAEVLGGVPPERAATLIEQWRAAEQRLGSDYDAFLSHLRVIEGRGRLPIIAGIRSVMQEAGGSEAFVSNVLLPNAEAYDIIRRAHHEGAPESAEITRLLRYLNWLGSSEWVPATMKWFSLHRCDPAQMLKFLQVVEPFAYSLRLLCIGAGKRATRFAAVLAALEDGSIFDPERSPCLLTSDEQRHITYNLRNLHERHPQTCKLVLLRLNDELAGEPQNLDPVDWTVEHILPQSPGRNGLWREWFPDNDERELLTQSLGNLVLVRRNQNDRASNQDFFRKKAIYFKHAQGDMPVITREISTFDTWTPDQVRAREERFIEIISRIWRLDLSAMRRGDDLEMARRRRRAV
nr:MAG: hypothetical protein DIU57_09425 [Pseudomonadota bacterium]